MVGVEQYFDNLDDPTDTGAQNREAHWDNCMRCGERFWCVPSDLISGWPSFCDWCHKQFTPGKRPPVFTEEERKLKHAAW